MFLCWDPTKRRGSDPQHMGINGQVVTIHVHGSNVLRDFIRPFQAGMFAAEDAAEEAEPSRSPLQRIQIRDQVGHLLGGEAGPRYVAPVHGLQHARAVFPKDG